MSVTIDSTVTEKLQEVINIKEAIKQAIEGKGQSLDGVPFTEYDKKIAAIQGDSSNVWANKWLPKQTSFLEFFVRLSDISDADLSAMGFSKDNTSQVTTVRKMFDGCASLTELPEMDLSNCTDMMRFAYGCTNLINAPDYDTRNVKSFESVFQLCRNLVRGPYWDARNVTTFASAFSWCDQMTDMGIKNINANLDLSTCMVLSIESAIAIMSECRNAGAARSIYFPRAKTDAIKSIYVRLIPITDEMRANDEFIEQKVPFEICESTDVDAMLITVYMTSKNWTVGFA